MRETAKTEGSRASIDRDGKAADQQSKRLNATFYAQTKVQRACPTCGKPMQRRTSKKGSAPHSQFWGCTAYPACKTLIAIT